LKRRFAFLPPSRKWRTASSASSRFDCGTLRLLVVNSLPPGGDKVLLPLISGALFKEVHNLDLPNKKTRTAFARALVVFFLFWYLHYLDSSSLTRGCEDKLNCPIANLYHGYFYTPSAEIWQPLFG
jgi:hypothetical protein